MIENLNNQEKDKLLSIFINLETTLNWDKFISNISNLLSKNFPELHLAIYWAQDNQMTFFSKLAEREFKYYFTNIKRNELTLSKEIIPMDNISNAYKAGIFIDNHYLGMFCLKLDNEQLSEFVKAIVNIILSHVKLTKYSLLLQTEIEKRTSIDKLTGLWNRNYFNERFREECERVKRTREVSSLAILSFDDLAAMSKMISNEEFNNIIYQASSTIKSLTRQTDWIVNWNNTEILFYFPNSPPESILEVFNRCMKNLIKVHPILTSIVGLCSTAETTTPRMLIQLASRRVELARKEAEKKGKKFVVCFASRSSGLQFWRPAELE